MAQEWQTFGNLVRNPHPSKQVLIQYVRVGSEAAEGYCVCLRSLSYARFQSWVEEDIGVVSRVLSLYQAVQLYIPGRLLAKD